jgi:tetratricopeptide (TPR) repeat protein
MKPHAFVAMPFGTKPDAQGNLIDFNRVYRELLEPALTDAGLDVLRADAEIRPGDIRTDMFQELLVADLVLADLTIDNPNVWYELGVRHALRARGVVLVSGGRATTAFDLYTDRKLRYGLKDGGPDPGTLASDRQKLAQMARAVMESWHGRKVSPVYHLMPNLREPDWRTLRIGDVLEFWERHDAWSDRVELAAKDGRVGDVLVLADEAPVAAFRADAWIRAGIALRKAERFDFALELLERGLAIDPDNLHARREVGTCLQRLALEGRSGHSLDRARQHYRNILEDHPGDTETWARLGRLDKDAWVASWRVPGHSVQQMRDEAAYEDGLLRKAIESYRQAYRGNPGHYYSGINALTLMHLHRDLTGNDEHATEMETMAGAVRFAAGCETNPDLKYWSLATLGDLAVLTGTPGDVKRAYKDAIAYAEKNWFALNSSRAQLEMLADLGFRPEAVKAGIETFDRALAKLRRPEERWRPRHVLLFSGHMIDSPDRPVPRFPADKEGIAAQKIAEALDQLGAGPEDLALTQGACGGDLLFSEACLRRGVKLHWLQPVSEPEFIQKSVVRCGEGWRKRYFDAKAELAAPPRTAPQALGPVPAKAGESYPYERCNKWLLYTALACGIEKVRFICLWNGGGGDRPGGTAHMYQEVMRRTGQVIWIDTRTAW